MTTPRQIGRYVVEGELGRGGMGVVLRARDPASGRPVALKLLHADPGPDVLARFQREAQAAGRLRHPGVVAIHEISEHQGKPFLAMDLVAGESLDALLRREVVAPRRAVALVGEVALALAHAHENGVLHRDVKPQNILVDADGRARLTDFGLARDLRADRLTKTGEVLGTPEYMSPEQAAGEPVGPATDVYALGAVLYRAVAGRAPFEGDSFTAILKRVIFDPVVPPSRVKKGVDPELEAIVLRCLEKEPRARPESAAALASELEAWLAKKPADVRGRRLLGVALVTGLVAGLALVGLAGAAALSVQRAAPPAPPPAAPPPGPSPASGRLHLAETLGDERTAMPTQAHTLAVSADGKRAATGDGAGSVLLWSLPAGERLGALRAPARPGSPRTNALAFAPDGARLLSGHEHGAVWLWDVTKRAVLADLSWPGELIRAVAFLDGERALVVSGRGFRVRALAPGAKEAAFDLASERVSDGAAILPDGRVFFPGEKACIVSLDGKIADLEPGRHPGPAYRTAVSPEGSLVAAVTNRRLLNVWGVESGSKIDVDDWEEVTCVAFVAERKIALGRSDDSVMVYDLEARLTPLAFNAPERRMGVSQVVAVPPDASQLLVGFWTGSLALVDRSTMKDRWGERGVRLPPVSSLAVSPDGRFAAVGEAAGWELGATRLWDLPSGRPAVTLPGGHEYVRGVAFVHGGEKVLTAGSERRVKVWSRHGEALGGFAVEAKERLTALAADPEGRVALAGAESGEIEVWRRGTAGSFARAHRFRPDGGSPVVALAVLGDAAFALAVTREAVLLLDLGANRESSVVERPAGETFVDLAVAGDRVVVASEGRVTFFKLAAPGLERLGEVATPVARVALSADGRRAATVARDPEAVVRIWDVATRQEVDRIDLSTRGDRPREVAFAPDSGVLVGTERGITLRFAPAR